MLRKRDRITKKCQWSLDVLDRAIKRVNDDRISLHKAAQEFKIPYSTLQKRYRRLEQTSPRLGRKPIFFPDQERILTDHLIDMTNLVYGLDSMKFRKIAYECAEQLKIPHNFNKKSKCAGPDWLEGFLKRNTNISVRKPESTSINRIEGFNKKEVELFYKNLEELMVKNKYEAHQIFNMDETGVYTVQEPGNILAKTGQKRVGTVTSWERRKTVTVVCAINFAGVYVPPMFTYPRQDHSPLLEKDGPPGAIYDCSKNGWTNESLFFKWLQHFKTFVKSCEDNKILLILDNHNSHLTLEAHEFCKANYITMLSTPLHSSHRLQPLDITFSGPLKKAYNRECDLYFKSKNLIKVTPYDIAGLFQKAYSKVALMDKAISGFRATGISPINTNIFNEDDLRREYCCYQHSG
ncbi:hypothetical protein ILUMI_15363 [Ignelater luminosus]|uniref:HTH psq-type domain-containing protein n=1 Tax=Ignelater luminosus TaxID=2038154 RepID=A0A8K0CNS1_IGNLU|nr:hypothetical protein ILUMI_15363 [Ignelater luminosus]